MIEGIPLFGILIEKRGFTEGQVKRVLAQLAEQNGFSHINDLDFLDQSGSIVHIGKRFAGKFGVKCHPNKIIFVHRNPPCIIPGLIGSIVASFLAFWRIWVKTQKFFLWLLLPWRIGQRPSPGRQSPKSELKLK